MIFRLKVCVIQRHSCGCERILCCVRQAKEAFRQWHGEKWLAPDGLLEQPGTVMRAALLPFWLFEVSVRTEYTATVGVAADPCAFQHRDMLCHP